MNITSISRNAVLGLVALLAFSGLALVGSGRTVEAATPPVCVPKLNVDVASSKLSQVPVGSTVIHTVRVVSAPCGTYEDVTLTFRPAGGQTLVTTGNTGPWACVANADQSLTCSRDAFPTGKSSTLTLTYLQGPYQDSLGRASACVVSESPALENCETAYRKALN